MLVDTFGPRLWGSKQLELAIEHLKEETKETFGNLETDKIDNVVKWVRGKESLTLYEPR